MEKSQAGTEHMLLDLKEGSELGIYICDSIVEDPQDSSLILKEENYLNEGPCLSGPATICLRPRFCSIYILTNQG